MCVHTYLRDSLLIIMSTGLHFKIYKKQLKHICTLILILPFIKMSHHQAILPSDLTFPVYDDARVFFLSRPGWLEVTEK